MRWIGCVAVLGVALSAGAQRITLGDRQPVQHVVSVTEPQMIAAGKPATVEMRFRVESGFHINSHTPRSKTLIGASVELARTQGVELGTMEYPAGALYSFSFDPTEKLDVYTGEFTVKAHVTAARGSAMLHGVLHYQACDNAMCYPPRELPVDVEITAR